MVVKWTRKQRAKFEKTIAKKRRSAKRGATKKNGAQDQGEAFAPFVPGENHVPDYYRARVRPLDGGPEVEIDAIEVIRAFGLGFTDGCAVKHLLRAGKKPGNPVGKDYAKAAEYTQRLVARS